MLHTFAAAIPALLLGFQPGGALDALRLGDDLDGAAARRGLVARLAPAATVASSRAGRGLVALLV
jgi:hypothetical protein